MKRLPSRAGAMNCISLAGRVGADNAERDVHGSAAWATDSTTSHTPIATARVTLVSSARPDGCQKSGRPQNMNGSMTRFIENLFLECGLEFLGGYRVAVNPEPFLLDAPVRRKLSLDTVLFILSES